MCGLVAVVGDMFTADKKIFHHMLKLDTTRGHHSTGIARVPNINRKDIQIVKDIGTPWDLERCIPDQFWNRTSGHGELQGDFAVLMGHNRWATVGKITPDNAHPFEAGNIVGAQNGTLPASSVAKLDDHEFYDTDTEALMFNIDLHGIDATIPKINGAWALTWYNKAEDSFNVLRNKERPLFFAWKKNGKVMYIASEAYMIYAATEKYGVELENDLCYSFNTDTLYSFKLGMMSKFGKDNLSKREIKGREAPPPQVGKFHYSSHYKATNATTNSAKESANVFAKQEIISPAKWEDWSGKKDVFFEFKMTGDVVEDEQRKEYFEAYTVTGNAPIRIYPSVKHPELEAVLGDVDVSTFAAKIRDVKNLGKSKFYIKIDLDTIMVATFASSYYKPRDTSDFFDSLMDDNPIVLIANGKQVDKDEWERKISCGCSWCNDQPKLSESGKIHWMSDNDFLCVDCSTPGSEASQYITHLSKVN